MELKRYILLDNNDLIDTKGQLLDVDNLPRRFGYSSYNSDILYYYDGTLSRPLGEIVKMSDNVFELVKEGDLVETKGTIYQVFKLHKDVITNHYVEVVYAKDTLVLECCDNESDNYYSYVMTLENVKQNIIAIYKKQGKNYICVWIKE